MKSPIANVTDVTNTNKSLVQFGYTNETHKYKTKSNSILIWTISLRYGLLLLYTLMNYRTLKLRRLWNFLLCLSHLPHISSCYLVYDFDNFLMVPGIKRSEYFSYFLYYHSQKKECTVFGDFVTTTFTKSCCM